MKTKKVQLSIELIGTQSNRSENNQIETRNGQINLRRSETLEFGYLVLVIPINSQPSEAVRGIQYMTIPGTSPSHATAFKLIDFPRR